MIFTARRFKISHLLFISLTLGTLSQLVTSAAWAQGSTSRGREPVAPRYGSELQATRSSPSGIQIQALGGIGTFQDIQPPLASSGDTRVDGTVTPEDSSNHAGMSLGARLGYQPRHSFGEGILAIGVVKASSNSPLGSLGSSYLRMNVEGGSKWKLLPQTYFVTSSELRRTMFRNTDSGHYLDAVLIRTGVEQSLGSFRLHGLFAFAPVTQFGYMQTANNGSSGSLSGTRSSLVDWSAKISWLASSEAELFTQIAEESITADISDIRAYNALGLKVADESMTPQSRDYRLATRIISVGATRKF
jgi:hypothetical protein